MYFYGFHVEDTQESRNDARHKTICGDQVIRRTMSCPKVHEGVHGQQQGRADAGRSRATKNTQGRAEAEQRICRAGCWPISLFSPPFPLFFHSLSPLVPLRFPSFSPPSLDGLLGLGHLQVSNASVGPRDVALAPPLLGLDLAPVAVLDEAVRFFPHHPVPKTQARWPDRCPHRRVRTHAHACTYMASCALISPSSFCTSSPPVSRPRARLIGNQLMFRFSTS